MAVTSLKPVKNRVDIAINYIRNPEKTSASVAEFMASLHSVVKSIEYAANDHKTEKRMYVTCLNCSEIGAIGLQLTRFTHITTKRFD